MRLSARVSHANFSYPVRAFCVYDWAGPGTAPNASSPCPFTLNKELAHNTPAAFSQAMLLAADKISLNLGVSPVKGSVWEPIPGHCPGPCAGDPPPPLPRMCRPGPLQKTGDRVALSRFVPKKLSSGASSCLLSGRASDAHISCFCSPAFILQTKGNKVGHSAPAMHFICVCR